MNYIIGQRRKLGKTLECLSKLTLLLVLIVIFVPFSPKMPAPGIDASWALSLNQAVAQGLSFGKDIIFTLGPYSSLYTKAYHPATDTLMMAGCVYLAFSYWICLLFLMKTSRWYWILVYCIPFTAMIYARDSLFFSYPLLAGILSYKIIEYQREFNSPSQLLFIFFLFAPFGLLPLIKGSMLIICLFILSLCFTFFLSQHQRQLALLCLSAPSISMVLFWLAAGQLLSSLPIFLGNSLLIASSFTEAMSLDGSIQEVRVYLLLCFLFFLFLFRHQQIKISLKIFLLAIYFIFLFVSFKTGFTRHLGHAFIPGTSLLMAALFLPFISSSCLSYLLIFASINGWYYINGHYTGISLRNNFISSYSAAWHGFKNRMEDKFWLEKNFKFTMNFLGAQSAFPILNGTTDIYSYEQTYLISSQNTWSPRPIFQSYSVFNSVLAKNNKQHLQGKQAPDNIIFKIEPIDQRIPSLEDGASWSILLSHYQITHAMNDFLVLHKRKISQQVRLIFLKKELHYLNEAVGLPNQHLLFVELDVKSTFLGRFATIFYKPQQLAIILQMHNGTIKHYRLSATMAKSDFMISPLIENTREFAALYQEHQTLDAKKVASIIITTLEKENWHWQNSYTLRFKFIRTNNV